METPSPSLLSLVTTAAELRAGGGSWAKIAEQVGRSPDTCRHWPRRFPELWGRLYREAEDQLIAEAGAEARTILRKLLRAEQPKVALTAAQMLLRAREQQRLQEERAERPTPGQLAADILEFAKQVKGLTDVQLTALVDHFLARRRPAPGSSAAGTADPASSPQSQ